MNLALRVVLVLTRGWPGRSCPECSVRPLRPHRAACPIGARDGGTWA